MPVARLKEFLEAEHVSYTLVPHSTAYTAQGTAALTHTPGQEMAKTVIVNMDGQLAMAVVPAPCQVDLARLQAATGASSVRLASEAEFQSRFPDCETGAMPPFGNLYGMRVFVDERLAKDREIAFNGSSHRELIRMSFADFLRLVQPTIAQFSSPASARAA
jgi:Ala-tRNA(Pro) deacylase